jgi:hypothetical protein
MAITRCNCHYTARLRKENAVRVCVDMRCPRRALSEAEYAHTCVSEVCVLLHCSCNKTSIIEGGTFSKRH